jgi:molybdopterin biosynthesis enzyme
MSHTVKVILGGLLLLGVFTVGARLILPGNPTSAMVTAARWFIPVWLVGAGVNMWIGVAQAGYSVAEEAPVFLLVFAVPAAVAVLIAWMLSHG